MDPRAALRSIEATLIAQGFTYVGPGAAQYEGPVKVHGKPVDIGLTISDTRFVTRPQVRLLNRLQVPVAVLAHIETDQGICYASGPGLPIDLYEPGAAILRVLEEVRRTLEASYAGRGRADYVDEYQQYWHAELRYRFFLPRRSALPSVTATSIFTYIGEKLQFLALANGTEMPGYTVRHPKPALVWYVDGDLGPGAKLALPKTLADLRRWFEAQPGLASRPWSTAFQHLVSEEPLFLVGQNAIIGASLKLPAHLKAAAARRAIRPEALPALIAKSAETIEITRIAGDWSSLCDVASRNNPRVKNLSGTSIALVGCGTIGSHLARMLVQTGAGSETPLALFDPDVLSEGNLGRHLLGLGDVGKLKAQALASELKRFHPQVQVTAYAEDALARWKILAQHDLVIDATGDWNIQCALNEAFLAREQGVAPKAILHSFVFMNGAGVQSFLNLGDSFGCFRCLRPKFDGPWRYPAGDEKDELNLRPATCGDGSFVPFTVDASVMAASLANKAALDLANGQPGARLRTCVVDFDRGRYQKPVSPPPSSQCPACVGRRGPA